MISTLHLMTTAPKNAPYPTALQGVIRRTLALRFGEIFLACLMMLMGGIPVHAQLEPVKKVGIVNPTKPPLVGGPDEPGLPRVLIIGDSISHGYIPNVIATLKGKANIYRPNANCGSTELGLANLDRWLGEGHWDVIHFNFGLHDLKYLDAQGNYLASAGSTQVSTPEVYGQNLHKIVARLKQTGARLIFATTTPVPPFSPGRVEDDDRKFNEVALKVMAEEGVTVDDLGGYVRQLQSKLKPFPKTKPAEKHPPQRAGDIQLPYNVHFTKEGYRQLAGLVSASIEKEILRFKDK